MDKTINIEDRKKELEIEGLKEDLLEIKSLMRTLVKNIPILVYISNDIDKKKKISDHQKRIKASAGRLFVVPSKK
jgi:hypothetical protein